MLTSFFLPTLAAAGALGSTAEAKPPVSMSPLVLFRSACMEGRVALKKDTAAPIRYRNLPKGAKLALGQTEFGPENPQLFRIPQAKEVPNPIFQIGKGKNQFLMVPVQASGPLRQSLEQSCVVIWRGDQFLEARQLLLPEGPASIPIAQSLPRDNALGFAHMSTTSGNLLLTAAALSGWTVLKSIRVSPETPGEP